MNKLYFPIIAAAIILSTGCSSTAEKTASIVGSRSDSTSKEATATTVSDPAKPINIDEIKIADAKTILERKQVPVLCYHQIRDWKTTDSKMSKDYIIPIETFKSHLKMLADSGYHTILPDEYYAYLNTGRPLPEKPIMLTFDDTEHNQYAIAVWLQSCLFHHDRFAWTS
jgi:hypothetical protein